MLSISCSEMDPQDTDARKNSWSNREEKTISPETVAETEVLSAPLEDQEPMVIQSEASEPVPIAGSYLTCRMPPTSSPADGNYAVYCDLTSDKPTDTGWTFFVSRNRETPVEVQAVRVDTLGKTWLLKFPSFAGDDVITISARYNDGSSGPITAATDLAKDIIQIIKNANSPLPQTIANTGKLFFMTQTQPAALNLLAGAAAPSEPLYFAAGDLIPDVIGRLNVQSIKTASLSELTAAGKVPYKLVLKKAATGTGLVFDLVSGTASKSEGQCFDISGKSLTIGNNLIRYPCDANAANQSFEAVINSDNISFKIRSTTDQTRCAGTIAPSSTIVVVNCTSAPSYRLSTVPN